MSDPNRYFVSEPAQRLIANELYQGVVALPLVCPHGHVEAHLFADPDYHFGNPVELLVRPDHYVLRILNSQGVDYASLGIPAKDGSPVEQDPRKIWQLFADHFYQYTATPTGMWINDELGLWHRCTPDQCKCSSRLHGHPGQPERTGVHPAESVRALQYCRLVHHRCCQR